jgi:serine/threonine protein kinase
MNNGNYNPGDIVLGNWTLTGLLGEGSFGRVFEAEREDFGTIYRAAVKIITLPKSEAEIKAVRAEGMDDASVTAYFRSFVEEIVREFALMSELKGTANVVSYEDHTVIPHTEGIGWDIIIRMELLTPLLDYSRQQAFTRQKTIKLGIDICRALELCQKFNIVHRDIKPENIFVSKLEDFKLGDFGIARTVEKTTSGLSKKGTYTYMAPEVYRDEEYGTGVDIYSLGIVLYRLLNDNRTPFMPAYPAPITYNDQETARAKRLSGAKIPNPKNAEGRLAEIILKACAYNPKDRYSSPIQMRQELEAIMYNREEASVIYPQGDETNIEPVEYVENEQHIPEGTEVLINSNTAHAKVFVASEKEDIINGDSTSTSGKTRDKEKAYDIIGMDSSDDKPGQPPAKKSLANMARVVLGVLILIIVGTVFFNFCNDKNNESDGDPSQGYTQASALPPETTPTPAPEPAPEIGNMSGAEDVSRTEIVHYDDGLWNEFIYDATDNLVKQILFDADGSILNWTDFEYDASGNRVKTIHFDVDDSILWWDEDEYDTIGNHFKTTYFNADGSMSGWLDYEYDVAGNLVKMIFYNADDSILWWNEHEYDSAGNMVKQIFFEADGSIGWWSEHEYDSAGNMVRHISFNADGSVNFQWP